ncbi:MAG: outer membrane lipoprotein carrier protein LolA [Candidatus Zixiibacteriota bacterium]
MKRHLLVLTIFLLLVSKAFPLTSDELSAKIEKRYKSFKYISISFIQTTKSEIFSTEKKTRGKMYLKNPDKFRIDNPSQSIVTDGKLLWLFSEKNKQVTIHKLKQSKKIFKPHDYIYNFRDNYKPQLGEDERVEKRSCFKLILTPKKEELFVTKMTLWIDKKNLLVRKLEYQDMNDNWVSLVFNRIKINSDLEDSQFVFTPPEGTEVVDLTE